MGQRTALSHKDDLRSSLDCTSHYTLDDVLLADEVEDDDRDDGHHQAAIMAPISTEP